MNKQTPDEGLLLTDEKISERWHYFEAADSNDGSWHYRLGVLREMLKAQLHKAFNTPITIEGGVCLECEGAGYIGYTLIPCPICKGTGKLDKTFTIKELIEEAIK